MLYNGSLTLFVFQTIMQKNCENNYTKRPLVHRFQVLYRKDKVAQQILMNLLGIVCDDKTFRINK
jgi:hypothetical protein